MVSAKINSVRELEENQASSILSMRTKTLPTKTTAHDLIGRCQLVKETNTISEMALQSHKCLISHESFQTTGSTEKRRTSYHVKMRHSLELENLRTEGLLRDV